MDPTLNLVLAVPEQCAEDDCDNQASEYAAGAESGWVPLCPDHMTTEVAERLLEQAPRT